MTDATQHLPSPFEAAANKYGPHNHRLAMASKGWGSTTDSTVPAHPCHVRDASRLIAEFFTEASVDADGVVTWNANGQVPPADILALWDIQDLSFDYEASVAAREASVAETVREYRANYRPPTGEHLAELRAAFAVLSLDETEVYRVYSGKPGCGCGCGGRYYEDERNIKRVVRWMKRQVEAAAAGDSLRAGVRDGTAFVETDTRYLWAYLR